MTKLSTRQALWIHFSVNLLRPLILQISFTLMITFLVLWIRISCISTAQLTLPLVLFTSGACKLVLFIFPRGPVRWQAMTIVISFEIVYYLAPSILFKICTIFKTLSLGSCGQYCMCIARSFCGNKLIGWETRQFIKKNKTWIYFFFKIHVGNPWKPNHIVNSQDSMS